jgi:hypothetical protein
MLQALGGDSHLEIATPPSMQPATFSTRPPTAPCALLSTLFPPLSSSTHLCCHAPEGHAAARHVAVTWHDHRPAAHGPCHHAPTCGEPGCAQQQLVLLCTKARPLPAAGAACGVAVQKGEDHNCLSLKRLALITTEGSPAQLLQAWRCQATR